MLGEKEPELVREVKKSSIVLEPVSSSRDGFPPTQEFPRVGHGCGHSQKSLTGYWEFSELSVTFGQ